MRYYYYYYYHYTRMHARTHARTHAFILLGLRPAVTFVQDGQSVRMNIGNRPSFQMHKHRYGPHSGGLYGFQPIEQNLTHTEKDFQGGLSKTSLQALSKAIGANFSVDWVTLWFSVFSGRPALVTGVWRAPYNPGLTTSAPRMLLSTTRKALQDNAWTLKPLDRDFLKMILAWGDLLHLQRNVRGHYGRYRWLRHKKTLIRDQRRVRLDAVMRASLTIMAMCRGYLVRRTMLAMRVQRYIKVVVVDSTRNLPPQVIHLAGKLKEIRLRASLHVSYEEIAWVTEISEQVSRLRLQAIVRGIQARDYYSWLRQLNLLRLQWLRLTTRERERVAAERAQRHHIHIEKLKRELEFATMKTDTAKSMMKAVRDRDKDKPIPGVNDMNAWRVQKDDYGLYYYNANTGETQLDPPPHWRDHVTLGEKVKLLYWKSYRGTTTSSTQCLPLYTVLCPHCYKRNSVVECEDCNSRFCDECFERIHDNPIKQRHLTTRIGTRKPRTHHCAVCADDEEVAQIWCEECNLAFCPTCYDREHQVETETKTLYVGTIEHQMVKKKNVHVHKKFKEGALVCMECDRSFATIQCPQCSDDVFCDDCHKRTHSKGHLHVHDIVPLHPWVMEKLKRGESYCVECGLKAATWVCESCDDVFCKTCLDATHSIGKRLEHIFTPYGRSLHRHGWEEEWDSEAKRFTFVNRKKKEMRTTKPAQALMDVKLGKKAVCTAACVKTYSALLCTTTLRHDGLCDCWRALWAMSCMAE